MFLAREYGVQVVAADWWIAPEEAATVFAEAGVGDRVKAVRAEAHALPFEEENFDAVVSVDAFEYFGTADSYLPYLVRFLRPGGQLGMATPALTREIRELGVIPPHIKEVVGWEAIAWHTADRWRFQWEITKLVEVTSARLQQDAWGDPLWARTARPPWLTAQEAAKEGGLRTRGINIDSSAARRRGRTGGGCQWPWLRCLALVFAVRVGVPVCEGIGWLAGQDEGLDSVVFARDVSPEDLAVRMGGTPGAAVELTGPDVTSLLHRPETGDSDVVRVAACGAWSYAVLHLADPGRDDLAVRASRGGVEVVRYVAMRGHPPAQFDYLRDGRSVCGFGIGEEAHRRGQDPDRLLPVLVAGGVLPLDGTSHQAARPGSAMIGNRLTLTVLEHHFGLCLPKSSAMRAPLPAYTVRGPLGLGPDPDVDIIRTWAAEHGFRLDWGCNGHVPASIREAYAQATGGRSS